ALDPGLDSEVVADRVGEIGVAVLPVEQGGGVGVVRQGPRLAERDPAEVGAGGAVAAGVERRPARRLTKAPGSDGGVLEHGRGVDGKELACFEPFEDGFEGAGRARAPGGPGWSLTGQAGESHCSSASSGYTNVRVRFSLRRAPPREGVKQR